MHQACYKFSTVLYCTSTIIMIHYMDLMFTTDDIGFKGAGGPGGLEVGVVSSQEPRDDKV